MGELLAGSDLVAPGRVEHYKTDLTWFAQQVSALHRVADLNQQAQAESELHRVMKALKMVKTHFSGPVLAAALKRAATFTCPMHREVIGRETDLCPKCGMMLDQVVKILPGNPGISTGFREALRASVRASEPLTVGKPATLHLTLRKANGDPVLPSDLIEAHTKKIHLLIIDSSLTDLRSADPPLRGCGSPARTERDSPNWNRSWPRSPISSVLTRTTTPCCTFIRKGLRFWMGPRVGARNLNFRFIRSDPASCGFLPRCRSPDNRNSPHLASRSCRKMFGIRLRSRGRKVETFESGAGLWQSVGLPYSSPWNLILKASMPLAPTRSWSRSLLRDRSPG